MPVEAPTLGRRLLWFATLWVAGVLATGAVAFGIRLWLSV